jgi:hypothetical protein
MDPIEKNLDKGFYKRQGVRTPRPLARGRAEQNLQTRQNAR